MSSADILFSHNIKPSLIRVMIYDFLSGNRTHPTVDEIYTSLHEKAPTLSKTTVYNTLKLFCKAGITKMITIEEQQARFDGCTDTHGHFLCSECGKVFDFDTDIPSLGGLEDFEIATHDVYCSGVCKNCLKK